MRAIWNWTVNIVFILVLVVLVAGILAASSSRVSGNGYPGLDGYRVFNVLSGSMSPTFDPGSVVITSRVDPKGLHKGDIITFQSPEEKGLTVTHRVVGITGADDGLSFVTRGDANNTEDPIPVPAANVVGRVIMAIPYLGYVAAYAQTRAGLVVMIVIPALLLIGMELRNIWNILAEESKEAAG